MLGLRRHLTDAELEQLVRERPVAGGQEYGDPREYGDEGGTNLSGIPIWTDIHAWNSYAPTRYQIYVDSKGYTYVGPSSRNMTLDRFASMTRDTGYFFGEGGRLIALQNGRVMRDEKLSESELADILGIDGGDPQDRPLPAAAAAVGRAQGLSYQQELDLIAAEQEWLEDRERQRQAWESAEGRKRREWQTKESRQERWHSGVQGELNRKNQYRMQAIGNLFGLLQQEASLLQQAKQGIVDLMGNDPLRASVAAQGGLQRGITPTQDYRNQLNTFAAPGATQLNIGPDVSNRQLDAQAEQLRRRLNFGLPMPGALVGGMALGGIIDMEQDGDGAYTVTPRGGVPRSLAPGEGMLVGEGQGGEGIAAGTAEVIRPVGRGRFEVIPIRAAAQGGASLVPDAGLPSQTNVEDMLGYIFGELGIGRMPRTNRNPNSYIQGVRPGVGGYHPLSGANMMQQLGINPRLMQLSGTDQFFYRDDLGQMHSASPDILFGEDGYRPQDVTVLNLESLAALNPNMGGWGQLPALTDMPPLIHESGISNMGQMASPIVVDEYGLMLPAPELLAPFWGRMDPETQRLMMQMYGLSNEMSAANAFHRMNFVTPSGTWEAGQTATLA